MIKKLDIPIISEGIITSKIYIFRKMKVMLDEDLAELYGVTTANLNRAVKRNILRFPEDFMFQLTKAEYEDLIFQFGTSSWGGRRKLPFAFTEQGVAMLSGIINSERAIKVNIQIMRVFTRMRKLLESHQEILKKLESLERKEIEQDEKIILIFEYLKQLEQTRDEELKFRKRKKIGFKPNKG